MEEDRLSNPLREAPKDTQKLDCMLAAGLFSWSEKGMEVSKIAYIFSIL